MEGEEEACNTRLCLGIGCGGYGGSEERGHGEGKPPVRLLMLFPTHLDTSKEEEDGNRNDHGKNGTWKKLKLTKEQSSMLEDIFKERNNLTMVSLSLSHARMYACFSYAHVYMYLLLQ